MSSGITGF